MPKQNTKRQTKAGDAVYETLREMAIEYRFRPGEKIIEVDLAEVLSVSRTPVREALNRLVSEELIQFRRNYGFYCRKLDLQSVLNLAEARRDIELATLPRVAERAPADAVRDLVSSSRQILESIASLPPCDLARAHEAFHIRLIEIGGNDAVTQIVRNLSARLRFVDKIRIEHADAPTVFLTQCEIAEALRDEDLTTAEQHLRTILEVDPQTLECALTTGLGRLYMNGVHMDISFSSN